MAFFKSLIVTFLFVSVIHCSSWEDEDYDDDWTELLATTVQDNSTLSLDVPLLLSVLTAIMSPQIKPPTPPDIPEWMRKFHEEQDEEPVPPTPPKIPDWMKKVQAQPDVLKFNTSIPKDDHETYIRPKHPVLPKMSIPDLPELTSKGVLDKKPKDGDSFEGIAVRTKSDTVVNKKGKRVKKVGVSSVANKNGKVKVSKVGDAPPDLNDPLEMPTNPNAKFKSFSTSSFTTSTTVDGVTKTSGGSDTTVQEDDKKESETVRMKSRNSRNKKNYEAYKVD